MMSYLERDIVAIQVIAYLAGFYSEVQRFAVAFSSLGLAYFEFVVHGQMVWRVFRRNSLSAREMIG